MRLDNFITKQIDTMSGAWPFHGKTHWYYIWGWTILWQSRLILCLGLDHFMAKHTDTMPRLHHFMTKHTDTILVCISQVWPFHDKTDWYYFWGLTISWQIDWYYVWCLTISCQSRLTLCLGFYHFMTKQTDTMSGAWPFHDKTDCTTSGAWPVSDSSITVT